MRVSIPGVRAPAGELVVHFEGRAVPARPGDTVAAALMDAGEDAGVFCGMGVCFDCLAVIDGVPNTRTCMTWVREGMDVRLQDGWSYHGA